jgi:hypothetical protein
LHRARRRTAGQVTSTPRHHHGRGRKPSNHGRIGSHSTDPGPTRTSPSPSTPVTANHAPLAVPFLLGRTEPYPSHRANRRALAPKLPYLQGLRVAEAAILGHPYRKVRPPHPYFATRLQKPLVCRYFPSSEAGPFRKVRRPFRKVPRTRPNGPGENTPAGNASRAMVAAHSRHVELPREIRSARLRSRFVRSHLVRRHRDTRCH